MKKITLKSIIALFMLAVLTLPAGAAITFKENSSLSEGKWIKIAISKSGMYEISYEKLLELGFENPQAVGVYGTGGAMMPVNFADAVGNSVITDDLEQIAVIHDNGRLIFYGVGPEQIKWVKSADYPETGGRFSNNGLNIYSNYGYYFLSDVSAPKIAEKSPELTATDATPEVTTAATYIYHEKDLYSGPNNSGQEIWGESLVKERTLKFPVEFKGFKGIHNGVIESKAMAGCAAESKYNFGVDNSLVETSIAPIANNTFYANALANNGIVKIIKRTANVVTALKCKKVPSEGNIDYFLVTYNRDIHPEDGENNLQMQVNVSGRSIIPLTDSDIRLIDITKPTAIKEMYRCEKGFMLETNRTVLLYNASLPLYSPESYQEVTNQNIHALAATEKPRMIIYHPAFLEQTARKIADFHKKLGEEVLALNVQQVYNEFSSGRPDPAALRLCSKMFYETPDADLSFVLLCGPSMAYLKDLDDPENKLIIPQSESGANRSESTAIIDLYGMTDSFYSQRLSTRPIRLSVAVLPFRNNNEGDRYLDKLKRYESQTDFHEWVENVVYMADDQNTGLHLVNTEELVNGIRDYSGGTLTVLKNYLSETGPKYILDCWIKSLRSGQSFSLYMGHGYINSIGSSTFFKTSDYWRFNNDRLSFMLLAGCQTTHYESLTRGIGETLVLDTPYGLIGSICTVRTVWAQDNFKFVKEFQKRLFTTNYSSPGKTISIGEILKATKNAHSTTNKFTFHLICDPMLNIPLPMLDVVADNMDVALPGSKINLQADIRTPEKQGGENMEDFNGKASVKWFAPSFSRNSQSLFSQEEVNYVVQYDSSCLEEFEVDVKDGKIDTEIFVPAYFSQYTGQMVRVSITAFDPEKRITASTHYNLLVTEPQEGEEPVEADNNPPVLTIGIPGNDPANVKADAMLTITATDDRGLRTETMGADNAMIFSIDGERQYFPHGMNISEGGRRLEISQSLAGLAPGHHSVFFAVKDYSGNDCRQSLSFTIRGNEIYDAPLVDTSSLRQSVTLNASADTPSSGELTLIILNPEGEISLREAFVSGWEWDFRDNQGNRVTPGLYKAYLLGKNSDGSAFSTHTADIPVLSSAATDMQ